MISYGRGCKVSDRASVSAQVELVLGDGVELGDDVTVSGHGRVWIGDYVKVHRGCWINCQSSVRLGHNCWVGERSVLDGTGGLTLGNNVGVGAGSQVWTHISFGDTFAGCRLRSARPVTLADDAWLCGPVLVQSCSVAGRVVVMGGSNVTCDIGSPNSIWAGNPARDVTGDMGGPPWAERSIDSRLRRFSGLLRSYVSETGRDTSKFVAVEGTPSTPEQEPDVTYFDVAGLTYTKRGTAPEMELMRWLLRQNKAKFVPSSR